MEARFKVVSALQQDTLESCKPIYEILSQLQSLQEIEDFSNSKATSLTPLFNKWNFQDQINSNCFTYVEPIKAQRVTLMKDAFNAGLINGDQLAGYYLNLAEFARIEGFNNIATRALGSLSYIQKLSRVVKDQIIMEEAQVAWTTDKKMGQYILRRLLHNFEDNQRTEAAALKLYGTWMAETKSENSEKIIYDYFQKSLGIYTKMEEKTYKDLEALFDTYDALAKFSDSEYQR